MSARGDCKALLAEALAVRPRIAGDPNAAALETAIAAAEAALAGGSGLRAAADGLDGVLGTHFAAHRKSKVREYSESIGAAILFALVLRGFLFEAFQIPTGSMEPTLLVGDHLFVAKSSYGLRLPFTTRYLHRWSEPETGDIVVFRFPVEEVRTQRALADASSRLEAYRSRNGGYPASLDDVGVAAAGRVDAWGAQLRYSLEGTSYRLVSPGRDGAFATADDLDNLNGAFRNGLSECVDARSLDAAKDYIKRVIGTPGDTVSMRGGVLYINGVAVDRGAPVDAGPAVHRLPTTEVVETLPSGASYRTWSVGAMPDFDEVVVREGHLLMMGDSRDNSSDGRCWGQVPIDAVKGSAMFIFFSRDRRPAELGGAPDFLRSIRWERFFDPVR